MNSDRTSKNRWVVLAAAMFVQACFSVLQQGFPALGPVLLITFDLSLAELGFLLASVSWGVVLTIYIWGTLADSFGEKAVVVVGLGGASMALLLASFQASPLGLGLALIASGALGCAAVVSSGRAVSVRFAGAELGFAMGLRQVAIPAGAVIAALMVPLIVWQFDLRGVFISLSIFAGVGAIVGFTNFSPRLPLNYENKRARTDRPPYTDSSVLKLAFASGLLQWAQVSLNAFITVMLVETQNVGVGAAAAIFAIIHILCGVMRILLGWWSDRSESSLPDLVRCAVAVTVSILAASVFVGIQGPISIGVLVLTTVLSLSWNGLAVTALVGLVGQSRVGSAMGLHATMMRLCSLPTAVLFGWAVLNLDWSQSLLILSIFPAGGAAILWSLHRQSRDTGRA
ncbi:MFS transporter [Pacificibacter marinus]|uniref:MFS transporter n=1 Tax=Pacificibacter marinus TaxID=658057 RepID=UPI001C07B5B2|nr:MFS transporter [Pacificibacter marinus]MBU2865644.1 MFS transporter [Pacificibacter marinus]